MMVWFELVLAYVEVWVLYLISIVTVSVWAPMALRAQTTLALFPFHHVDVLVSIQTAVGRVSPAF